MKKQRQSALLAFIDVDLSKFDSAETSSDESFKIENHPEEDSDFGSSDDSGSDSESDDSDEKSSDNEPELVDIDESKAGPSSANLLLSTEKQLEKDEIASGRYSEASSNFSLLCVLGRSQRRLERLQNHGARRLLRSERIGERFQHHIVVFHRALVLRGVQSECKRPRL